MKILRLAGLLTLVMTLILFLINMFGFFKNDSVLEAIREDATLAKIGAFIILSICAVKFIIGLIGVIAKGRKLCMICGIVLIVISVPTDFANTPMLVLRLICLAVALMYFIGALMLPRYGVVEGEAMTAGAKAEKAETVDKSSPDGTDETVRKGDVE